MNEEMALLSSVVLVSRVACWGARQVKVAGKLREQALLPSALPPAARLHSVRLSGRP